MRATACDLEIPNNFTANADTAYVCNTNSIDTSTNANTITIAGVNSLTLISTFIIIFFKPPIIYVSANTSQFGLS
jgi:hypothetical protein